MKAGDQINRGNLSSDCTHVCLVMKFTMFLHFSHIKCYFSVSFSGGSTIAVGIFTGTEKIDVNALSQIITHHVLTTNFSLPDEIGNIQAVQPIGSNLALKLDGRVVVGMYFIRGCQQVQDPTDILFARSMSCDRHMKLWRFDHHILIHTL